MSVVWMGDDGEWTARVDDLWIIVTRYKRPVTGAWYWNVTCSAVDLGVNLSATNADDAKGEALRRVLARVEDLRAAILGVMES